MPWYRIGEPGRDTIVHVRVPSRQAPPRCLAPRFAADNPKHGSRCHRSSVALCDAPTSVSPSGRLRACDQPICDLHRTSGGDNVDYCPRHANKGTTWTTIDSAPSTRSRLH